MTELYILLSCAGITNILKYGDIFLEAEKQYSEWNFNVANTEVIFRHFDDAENLIKTTFELNEV